MKSEVSEDDPSQTDIDRDELSLRDFSELTESEIEVDSVNRSDIKFEAIDGESSRVQNDYASGSYEGSLLRGESFEVTFGLRVFALFAVGWTLSGR